MDIEHVKEMLNKMGERCMKLRDRLDAKGTERLTSEEMQTVRFSAFPSIGESMNEIKSAFLTGDPKWLEHAMESTGKYMLSFMD